MFVNYIQFVITSRLRIKVSPFNPRPVVRVLSNTALYQPALRMYSFMLPSPLEHFIVVVVVVAAEN